MNEIWKAVGAAAWGAVGNRGLRSVLDETSRKAVEALCPNPGGVYVAAFPYFAGTAPGNLSLYCRGEDYHRVLLRRLSTVCDYLKKKYPSNTFIPGTDNSPLPEKVLACMAGVGRLGKHGLLIVPPHGSYVFLGTILTDLVLEDHPYGSTEPSCDCETCVRACPTGALTADGFDASRCLAHLTQKKGDLTPEEEALLKKSPMIWGCDICQKVCPLNRGAAITPLPEFRENLICSLSARDLEGMTQKEFQDAYGDRAFAWRGIGPLKRNLELKSKE